MKGVTGIIEMVRDDLCAAVTLKDIFLLQDYKFGKVYEYYNLILQFIQVSQRILTYSTKNRLMIMRSVTGMIMMATQDLHIPVTRQDRL